MWILADEALSLPCFTNRGPSRKLLPIVRSNIASLFDSRASPTGAHLTVNGCLMSVLTVDFVRNEYQAPGVNLSPLSVCLGPAGLFVFPFGRFER